MTATEPMIATERPGSLRDRWAALTGLAGVLLAAGLVGWLDLTTSEDVWRHTVSGYVFTDPVPFTAAVIALVLGSATVLLGLLRAGVLAARHPSVWLLGAWIAGMTAVAVFPKHDWTVGPSFSGHVHRVASLVAFVALPLAILLLTRAAVARGMRRAAHLAAGLAIASYAYLGFLAWTVYDAGRTGTPWWQAVPLGLTERILLALEVAALAVVAVGLLRRPVTGAPEKNG
ncbi:DUF998 domain-containing protein [Cumulibacter manganitolerans]|uniref:DUF998 domain-containing protein n=1 Tax=Cumulibacter manganitolerans TaxID=1884992 RepID=UPI001885FDDC|nr:DUF998 domain-containing protein [Cumulibacter manganitolerans]